MGSARVRPARAGKTSEPGSRGCAAGRQWRVLFIGFSRSGWTDAARLFARDFAKEAPEEHLRIIGMELLDLKRIDDDLAAWQ
jgi:hypothetical protein